MSSLNSSEATLREILENDNELIEKVKKDFVLAQERAKKEYRETINVSTLDEVFAKLGIHENTPLVKIKTDSYGKSGRLPDVSFTQDVEKRGEQYLIPGDPLGRTLIEKRPLVDGYALVINAWNWQKETDAFYGILPGAIVIKVSKGEGRLNRVKTLVEEIKIFERRTKIYNEAIGSEVDGYLYKIVNGGYKQSEFYLLNGQLYREKFNKAMSPILKAFGVNPNRYLNYDLSYHFRVPRSVTNGETASAETLETIKEVSYLDGIERQKWEADAGWKGYIRFLFKQKETVMKYFDANGDPTTTPIPCAGNTLWTVLNIIVIILIFPISLLLRSYLSGRSWRKWVEERKNKAKAKELYDDSIEEVEHERMRNNVLKVDVKGCNHISEVDASVLFIKSFKRVRILILAGVRKWHEKVDLKSDFSLLANLDQYTKELSMYLGSEYAKTNYEIKSKKKGDVAIKFDSPYDKLGLTDEEIWDKYEFYFYNIEHQLRKAIETEDEKLFDKVLDETGISTGKFDERQRKKIKDYLRSEGCVLADSDDISDTIKEFIKRIREPVRKGIDVLFKISDEDYQTLKKHIRSFWRQKILRFFGFQSKSIHNLLGEAAYYLPYGIILGFAGINMFSWAFGVSAFVAFSELCVKLLSLAALILAIINTIHQYRKMSLLEYESHRIFRFSGLAVLLVSIGIFCAMPSANLAAFVLKALMLLTMFAEGTVNLISGRSLIGLSFYRNYRPSIGLGRPRAVIMQISKFVLFIGIGLVMAWFSLPWIYEHFMAELTIRALLGMYLGFGLYVYLMQYGIWPLLTFIAAQKESHGPMGVEEDTIKKFINRGDYIVFNYVGQPLNARGSTARDADQVIACLQHLIDNLSPEVKIIFDEIRTILGNNNLKDEDIIKIIRESIGLLVQKETQADVNLFSLVQIEDPNCPAECRIPFNNNDELLQLRIAHYVTRHATMFYFGQKPMMHPFDTAINIFDLIARLAKEGFGRNLLLVPTPNKYNNWHKKDGAPNYHKLGVLFEHITGGKFYSTLDSNPSTLKSGAMHGMYQLPRDMVKRIKYLIIMDRSANSLDTDRFVYDLKRMISKPEVVITVALRNTTNIRMPLGNMSWLVEGGHGYAMLGLNDKIGTGWMNIMQVFDQGEDGYLADLRDPNFPRVPLTRQMRKDYSYSKYKKWYQFGLIGLGPHMPHQSEDIADVLAQTHNLIALGKTPVFALSTALAYKMRESFSSPELEAAVPRWSAGLVQFMGSFLFQVINEYGPESVFERDARRDTARFYITMPFAIASLFLIPIGIVFDILPFVGLGVAFLTIGFLFNQVVTLNGLGAIMRATTGAPFASIKNIVKGITGLLLGGAISYFLFGNTLLAVLTGIYFFFTFASLTGYSRWLSDRKSVV